LQTAAAAGSATARPASATAVASAATDTRTRTRRIPLVPPLLPTPAQARRCDVTPARPSRLRRRVPLEERDLPFVTGAHLGVGDALPGVSRQAQHADLALVEVVVDLVGGLARLLEGERLRQDGVDHPFRDQAVGLPRLFVVGEVARLDRLEPHPAVA